jgi:hypothetical protein
VPKQLIDDNVWDDRIQAADRYYKQWEGLFKCKILEQYYEGIMWKSQRELGYNPYVINKFFENIAIKIAEFMPTTPVFTISPRQANSQYDLEAAIASAQIKEDTLNTIIQDNRIHFADEMEMAYKDSFTRFGLVEVGYSADWIINPNAMHPLLNSDANKYASGKPKIKEEPEELPANEKVFIKHISAKRFRVGGIDHKYLQRCTWCGYYDFVNKLDLKAMKGLMNEDKIGIAQAVFPDPDTETNDRQTDNYKGNAVKIWHIWDLRANVQLLILDSPRTTIYQRKFKRLPLLDYRPDRRVTTEGFYPIPPAFNWLSPQDEINETREMLRAHRRRFVRKFMVVEGQMDDEEIEKFETGPDGAIVKVKRTDALQPIQNADLGNALNEAIQTSADDLDRIAGVSPEDQGIPDRTTATQAQITAQKGAVRSQKDQLRITNWMALIGREILLTVKDKFVLGMYAKLSSPEGENFLGSVQEDQDAYRYVTSEDLDDGFDFRINVDVTSLSATAQMDEKQKFMEFISTLQQFPLISFSPILVREAAYRIGYRNVKAIKEFQKMALLMQMGKIQQMEFGIEQQKAQMAQMTAQLTSLPGGNAAQGITAQMSPPTAEQARQQMGSQALVGNNSSVQ